jgi:hypothetical protein
MEDGIPVEGQLEKVQQTRVFGSLHDVDHNLDKRRVENADPQLEVAMNDMDRMGEGRG